MSNAESTCWTVIHGAARGDREQRELFARSYEALVRDFLRARWTGTSRAASVDDAVQDVFVECFKGDGALDRADVDRPGGFRPFLRGVVRNVAHRFETGHAADRHVAGAEDPPPEELAETERGLSQAFDRAWARSLLREAAKLMAVRARSMGAEAERRVDLLHLRFYDGVPIREIARRWDADPAVLHHEYALARQEFRDALQQVVAFHHPGPPVAVEKECAELLAILQ